LITDDQLLLDYANKAGPILKIEHGSNPQGAGLGVWRNYFNEISDCESEISYIICP